MHSELFYLKSLDRSISYTRSVWLAFIITVFVEIFELNAHGVDPDQTPHSVESDLDLHFCLFPFIEC